MNIGIVKENSEFENRVPITPSGVHSLVQLGAQVYVEKGAGSSGRFMDEEYEEAGASIVYRPEEAVGRADLLLKVLRPTMDELDLIREGQTVFSFLHLPVAGKPYIKKLIEKKIGSIGFELVEDRSTLPILHAMSEIAGAMAIQVASRYLETTQGGRGVMLGGIAGVPPSAVVILGAGVVGMTAAQEALGAGAQVIILDIDVRRLREMEHRFQRRVTTAVANQYNLSKAIQYADVFIGAIMIKGERAPVVVTESMVKSMKSGAVIVDVSIDQGGCVETSRPTTFVEPVYVAHDVIHYCVPNMAAAVARTATNGLNNVLLPYLEHIVREDLQETIRDNEGFQKGVCTFAGACTNEHIAAMYGYDYVSIDKLISKK
jgi:alanine dehydrogenase